MFLSLSAAPPPSPPPSPPPTPPPSPPPTMRCGAVNASIKLNNTNYADPNGPRTTATADGCCALCSQTAGCGHWSFQIDPSVKGTQCRWATLTYCCWMHAQGPTGAADPVAAAGWTSGSPPPPPPPPVMPSQLPSVVPRSWPSSAYTLRVGRSTGVVLVASTPAGVLTGQATLLQAASAGTSPGTLVVPSMQIEDEPFREWR